jgi:hypothetical protein
VKAWFGAAAAFDEIDPGELTVALVGGVTGVERLGLDDHHAGPGRQVATESGREIEISDLLEDVPPLAIQLWLKILAPPGGLSGSELDPYRR